MSKYKEALEAANAFSDTWQFMIDHHATIKEALKICHRLETGDVSTDSIREGFKVLEDNYDGIDSSRMGIQGFDRAFAKTAKQLLKEEEEG